MKYINCIFIILLIFFASSCIYEHDNKGYPSTVNFGKSGGVQYVYGNACFLGLNIHDYNNHDNYESDHIEDDVLNDSIILTHKWLTIKHAAYSNELILIAEPLETDKKRVLEIFGDFGTELAEIKVTQK